VVGLVQHQQMRPSGAGAQLLQPPQQFPQEPSHVLQPTTQQVGHHRLLGILLEGGDQLLGRRGVMAAAQMGHPVKIGVIALGVQDQELVALVAQPLQQPGRQRRLART
jgi:hypothetical protein